MALEKYRAKRDFNRTKEPAGEARPRARAKAGGAFVIQKHDATRLHYDLRLEHGGVMWSWAVTRGPSLDPSEKRLAVHVEDHPVEYNTFEGTIPKGEYGGGTVIVWDRGTWEPEGDPEFGMKKGHIGFTLKGEKLAGKWHLVRLPQRRGEKRDNWLLIKSDDEAASVDGDILEDRPESARTGRLIEQVAEADGPVWSSKDGGLVEPEDKPVSKSAAAKKPAKKAAPAKRKHPAGKLEFVEPCLATLKATPPSGAEWLHEVKFDGYRMQAQVSAAGVKLLTRTGLDWTKRFGATIAEALQNLGCDDAILDGEVVVLDPSGASSFSRLQQALSENSTGSMVYYLFDILHLDGEDLRSQPLVERKQALGQLLGEAEDGPLRFSDHFSEPGSTMLRHACRLGLEGVVSKRADAPYSSGRGLAWIKSKCTQRQEFVIAGYVPSQKTGRGLRSLVLGYHEKGRLRPAGRVGTGFSAPVADDLLRRMKKIATKTSAFEGKPGKERGVIWVEPKLVAEVEFRSWTHDGILRHASFQGLREDKPAEEVVEEKPSNEKPARAAKSPKKAAPDKPAAKAAASSTSVKLSSPDKKLWPDEGVTKKALLDHYEAVWPRMKQFVIDRPLALLRAPDGIHGQRFFQKHSSPGMHEAIHRMKDPEDASQELLSISDFDGLAALVQYGVVEIHIWGAKIDTIETPDQIVFDLDPDEGLDVDAVRVAALDLRARLDELGLPNLVKTSGGKGYHVMVPLKPSAGWDDVKGFAHDFAQALEQAAPDRYTATLSKKARHGRIFVDYLRNGRGSTTVAPYSSRAKKGATISLPVEWKDIEKGVAPNAFEIGDAEVAKRLKAADPWVKFFELGKPLKRS